MRGDLVGDRPAADWKENQFGNTALYAVIGGVGATALSAFAGYGFSRFSFRSSKVLFYLTLAALLVPITALIALFLLLQRYWRGGLLLGSIAN